MKKTITIEGMMCGHCTGRVEKALNALEGVTLISVSVEEKNAIVKHEDNVSNDTLKTAIEDQGYDVITIE